MQISPWKPQPPFDNTYILTVLPGISYFWPQFPLLQNGNNNPYLFHRAFMRTKWGIAHKLALQTLKPSTNVRHRSSYVLLSWLCKNTVILVFWKDLPWKPNNKSKRLNHNASTATRFYSHPLHTQPLEMMVVLCSHWDTYFLFCKLPRQLISRGLKQRLSLHASKAHHLERAA